MEKGPAHSSSIRQQFEEIFHTFYPRVKAFALRMLHSEGDAEDITQDIFAKLWSQAEVLPEIRLLDSYIFRMVKNSVLNHIRHRNLGRIYFEKSVERFADMYELLHARETEAIIDSVVEAMPPQRKNIFVMSRSEGLSNQEIANRLGISRRTVDCHIMLVLTQLKKSLK